jgi:hypothetical protein
MVRPAEAFAGERLADADAAGMFLERRPGEDASQREIEGLYEEAEPELTPARAAGAAVLSLLAPPPGAAGERFRELASDALPEVELAPAVSEDDILFCCEISNLKLADLEQLGPAAQDAYRQMSAAENFSPHTRIDVAFTPPQGF